MRLDALVDGLRDAVRTHEVSAVRELVHEAISGPPVASELGDPFSSQLLVCEPGLLAMHVVVDPGYETAPHDHLTWSVVGVQEGSEDNVFFRRVPGDLGIEQAGGRTVEQRQVLMLDEAGIHRIASPRERPLMALHVYGANIFAMRRSAWDPTTMAEEAYDFDRHAGGPKVRGS